MTRAFSKTCLKEQAGQVCHPGDYPFSILRDMVSLSVVCIPLLLCLAALVAVLVSWPLDGQIEAAQISYRSALFRTGVVFGALGLVVTASCFVDQFPLSRHPDGSLSTTWLDRAWMTAFALAVSSTGLALFGRGQARLLLLTTEVFAFLLTYASVLQNGV